jgi:GNAT superfamily N-acetyltransferase
MHILLKYRENYQEIGYLNACLDDVTDDYIEKRECVVTDLYVDTNYRNKGIATSLLLKLRDILLKIYNITNISLITLTDCSDHFGKSNNVYLKTGFTYDKDGLPEMTWEFRKNKGNKSKGNKNIIVKIL